MIAIVALQTMAAPGFRRQALLACCVAVPGPATRGTAVLLIAALSTLITGTTSMVFVCVILRFLPVLDSVICFLDF